MEATARLSSYRQSPRKVRLVADLIKGKSADEALLLLSGAGKRAAPWIEKLVRSALANAKAKGADTNSLVVKEVRVDKGPVMKRWMPRAMGRAARINKRSSHIMLTLTEKEAKTKKSAAPEKKSEKPSAKTKAKKK